MKTSLVFASLFASAFAVPSFSSQYELDGGNRRQGGSIIDKLREDKKFSRFVEVLEKEKGLRDDLENRDKETTVFAPTNDAFKKIEDEWAAFTDENKPSMRDVLRYHIAGETKITGDSLHAGALVPTNLRLKSLQDRHQRIRVFRFHDMVWLNMRARVVEPDIEADNGRIHAIDHVLCPPDAVTDQMYTVPTVFSTTLAALERTNLASELDREHGITVFAPNNQAWERLGLENLKYLFSCVGQKTEYEDRNRRRGSSDEGRGRPICKGVKDLKSILKNHVGRDLAYTTDIMQRETIKMRTFGDAQLTVCALKKQGGGQKGWGRKDDEDRDEKHHDVRKYNFVLNNGEARVTFTDGLANNGAIQVVDSVLVGDIKLPHDRLSQ